jgi:hypothetical protein
MVAVPCQKIIKVQAGSIGEMDGIAEQILGHQIVFNVILCS